MNAPHPMLSIRTPARHYIGGAFRAPAAGAELPVIDPSDGKPFASIARGDAPDVDAAVRAARAAFDGGRGKLAPVEKGRRLMALSRAILDREIKIMNRTPVYLLNGVFVGVLVRAKPQSRKESRKSRSHFSHGDTKLTKGALASCFLRSRRAFLLP